MIFVMNQEESVNAHLFPSALSTIKYFLCIWISNILYFQIDVLWVFTACKDWRGQRLLSNSERGIEKAVS